MSVDIGARVGIDGEKGFRDSLSAINSEIKTLNSEMKSVVTAFTGMEESEEAVTAKTEVLQKSMEASAKKIELLEKQSDRAKAKLSTLSDELETAKKEFGENSEQALKAQNAYNRQVTAANKLQDQINRTTVEMNKMQSEARQLESATDKLGNEMKDTAGDAQKMGTSFKDVFSGTMVANLVQSLAGGIANLAESTKEYQKIMGTLETSSEKAGYTAEETAKSYNQLYGIIGDEQSSATALANLQALGLEQKELETLTEGVIGAWATYGDSIPIDGLAEAVNETIRVGAVTGTFADVLNWAGTSEDEFNAKLANCSTEAERTQLVLDELAKQGLADTAEAWRENNAELVKMNEAQAALSDVMAEYGAMAMPITATVKGGIAGILSEVLSLINGVRTGGMEFVQNLVGGISAGLPSVIAMAGETVVSYIDGLKENFMPILTTGAEALGELVKGIIGAIPDLVAQLPAIVTALTGYLKEAAPELLRAGIGILMDIVTGIIQAIPDLVAQLPNLMTAIVQGLKDLDQMVVNAGSAIVQGLWEGISDMGGWISEKIRGFGDNVLDSIKDFFGIHSPSTVMRDEVGTMLGAGLAEGITASQGEAVTAVQDMVSAISDEASAMPSMSANFTLTSTVIGADDATLDQSYESLIAGMTARQPLVEAYLMEFTETLVELVNGYQPDFVNAGLQLMKGVEQGVKNGQSGVVNTIVRVLKAAVAAAKRAMSIHSPSAVYAEIGGYMAEGLGVGWSSEMKKVSKTITGSMVAIATTPAVATAGTSATYSRSYGDINLYIDTVNNGNGRDVRTIAEELEFIRRNQDTGKGGGR